MSTISLRKLAVGVAVVAVVAGSALQRVGRCEHASSTSIVGTSLSGTGT